MKSNSQTHSPSPERPGRADNSSDDKASDYYYDDATGYEIYQGEDDTDEDSETGDLAE